MDLLDFEDYFDTDSVSYSNEELPDSFDVVEISVSGEPIAVHRMQLEDLPYIASDFKISPLEASFNASGSASGRASFGGGRGSVRGKAHGKTKKPTKKPVSRPNRYAGPFHLSTIVRGKTKPVTSNRGKTKPVIDYTDDRASKIFGLTKSTTIPLKKLVKPSEEIHTLVATPKLSSAGTLCGCKEVPRITKLLEKANIQREATNEHNIINKTSAFRKSTLEKLANIQRRVSRPFSSREAIILAACGMGRNK